MTQSGKDLSHRLESVDGTSPHPAVSSTSGTSASKTTVSINSTGVGEVSGSASKTTVSINSTGVGEVSGSASKTTVSVNSTGVDDVSGSASKTTLSVNSTGVDHVSGSDSWDDSMCDLPHLDLPQDFTSRTQNEQRVFEKTNG